MSVGGLGLAGLSRPAAIIQQLLRGGAGKSLPNPSLSWMGAWIISARLDVFRRCARSAEQPASLESSWHRHLSPKPVCMKGCLHNQGKKERHDSTISESK